MLAQFENTDYLVWLETLIMAFAIKLKSKVSLEKCKFIYQDKIFLKAKRGGDRWYKRSSVPESSGTNWPTVVFVLTLSFILKSFMFPASHINASSFMRSFPVLSERSNPSLLFDRMTLFIHCPYSCIFFFLLWDAINNNLQHYSICHEEKTLPTKVWHTILISTCENAEKMCVTEWMDIVLWVVCISFPLLEH